ncbi:MAG: chemotaxis protein CheX [Lachnospiraceae bacterium]|nr:chemotaxis protein CheX [Lachnospiraceae bacterium]
MVEYILGNYLVETGKIKKEDLKKVIDRLDETRVKMGLLAVSEGMMTVEQAETVNKLQATLDKRFGDIAVEKGYLTEEQISNLLKKQGNAYLAFAQALVNENLLQMKELEDVMDGFQQKNSFSKSDMEDLRSDEPERIVPLFLPVEAMAYKDIAGLIIRTLIRCVDRHAYMGKAVILKETAVQKAAFQTLTDFTAPVVGFKEIELGFVEGDGGLVDMTTAFCKENEPLNEEDALDAAGEFLNWVNGLYASSLSRNGVDSELKPPVLVSDERSVKEDVICSIPVYMGDRKATFLIVGRK